MAHKVTEFGSYLSDDIFQNIFFQPDDELAARYIKKYFSPELKVRINGASMTGKSFEDMIVAARAKTSMGVVQVEEILASPDASKASGGSVSHFTVFSAKDKDTGDEKQYTNLTIVTCAPEDGDIVITEWTEVEHIPDRDKYLA